MKRKIIYGLIIFIVLTGACMLHGGIRAKVMGNIRYQQAIRNLDSYELLASENNIASFNGQITELLRISREKAYTGVKHKLSGELIYNDKKYSVLFSPVGMYGDHWKEKPSIRVSLLDDTLDNGMSEFGFLRPVTRDFLGDWIAGILSEEKGLINLYREAVALNFDGKGNRTFLMEESLRGYSNRKEKHGFAFKYVIENDSCIIEPYNKTVSKECIAELEDKLTRTLTDPSRAAELFDVEKMAKYYVVTDLVQGFHQLVEFNTHFFYDLDRKRLEPIGREWNTSNYAEMEKTTCSAYLQVSDPLFLPSQLHRSLLRNVQIKERYAQEQENIREEDLLKSLRRVEERKQRYTQAMWKDLGRDTYSFEYLLENLHFIQSSEE